MGSRAEQDAQDTTGAACAAAGLAHGSHWRVYSKGCRELQTKIEAFRAPSEMGPKRGTGVCKGGHSWELPFHP